MKPHQAILTFIALLVALFLAAYEPEHNSESSSSVEKTTATHTNTGQQSKIEGSQKINSPADSIKYLYLISSESGQVIISSTVQGKIFTSGGMCLTATAMTRDHGTFCNASPYFEWFDINGNYHQHLFTEGQVVAVLDQPLVGKLAIIPTPPPARK
ncbi:MAG: hypothetical protein WC714_19630 [Candidatus Obscuribacterales bacterium]|jgi:hypothetical protein